MIVYKKVETEIDAEILRQHRNKCKDFMTRSTAYITEEDQQAWFKTAHEKYDLFIAYEVVHGAVIIDAGYGVIHREPGQSLLTGGLVPEYRNKGIGQQLFKFLIDQCRKDRPIRLEVLKENTRAFAVYLKLGFKVTGENSKIYFMEYEYDSVI